MFFLLFSSNSLNWEKPQFWNICMVVSGRGSLWELPEYTKYSLGWGSKSNREEIKPNIRIRCLLTHCGREFWSCLSRVKELQRKWGQYILTCNISKMWSPPSKNDSPGSGTRFDQKIAVYIEKNVFRQTETQESGKQSARKLPWISNTAQVSQLLYIFLQT